MEKKMDKKVIIAIAVVVVILVAVASFFAGTKYAQSAKGGFSTRGNFTGAPGQVAGMRTGTARMGGQAGRMNFIDGEVVSLAGQTLTMKLTAGGSKIILLGSSTTVSKSTAGSVADLTPGAKLMISGDTNADGSVTARTIQLRDANAISPVPGTPPIK